jgi:hypothetical protein
MCVAPHHFRDARNRRSIIIRKTTAYGGKIKG